MTPRQNILFRVYVVFAVFLLAAVFAVGQVINIQFFEYNYWIEKKEKNADFLFHLNRELRVGNKGTYNGIRYSSVDTIEKTDTKDDHKYNNQEWRKILSDRARIQFSHVDSGFSALFKFEGIIAETHLFNKSLEDKLDSAKSVREREELKKQMNPALDKKFKSSIQVMVDEIPTCLELLGIE